jgi:hypothetical protein
VTVDGEEWGMSFDLVGKRMEWNVSSDKLHTKSIRSRETNGEEIV